MTTSASIRSSILKTILSDVKSANAKTQNHKFNRLVQGLLYDMIDRSSSTTGANETVNYTGTGTKKTGGSSPHAGKEGMWAVKLAAELWRKGIWRDSRTANLVASACFHSNTKVQSAAMHFFLDASASSGLDGSDSEESEEDASGAMSTIRRAKHRQQINKKNRGSEKAAQKEIRQANAKRKAAELKAAEPGTGVDNSALNLLHDPQSFAEKLYDLLAKNDKKFTLDHKVLIMQLFGRVTGLHKLYVLPFYSFIVKYLVHHQLQVTTILVALANSVHELVPPDVLTPVIRKLAHEFVHPGVSSQVIAAGLNSIREVCKRQPEAMEPDLLEDLIEYRKSRDKGVMAAGQGVLQLYREVNPDMLKRRERGKTATMNALAGMPAPTIGKYGIDRNAQTTIEGLDLLESYLTEKAAARVDGEDGSDEEAEEEQDGWEVDSSASDESDDGWIAVSSDEEGETYFDESEDEDARVERRSRKRVRLSEVQETADDVLQAGKLEVSQAELAELDKEKADKAEASLLLATTRVHYFAQTLDILTRTDFMNVHCRFLRQQISLSSMSYVQLQRKQRSKRVEVAQPSDVSNCSRQPRRPSKLVRSRMKVVFSQRARLSVLAKRPKQIMRNDWPVSHVVVKEEKSLAVQKERRSRPTQAVPRTKRNAKRRTSLWLPILEKSLEKLVRLL